MPSRISGVTAEQLYEYNGEDPSDTFGHQLAVGDLNGDGGPDLVVTAAFVTDDSNRLGQAYVFMGEVVACDGDVNGDGTVDPLDSGFVLARFGCSVGTGDPDCDSADPNGDGNVDPLDVGFVLARFGACP